MSEMTLGILYGICIGIVITLTAVIFLSWRDKRTGRIDIPDIKRDSQGDLWVVTEYHDGYTCMVKLIPENIENLKGDLNEQAIRHS